jgi:hypothetical protein
MKHINIYIKNSTFDFSKIKNLLSMNLNKKIKFTLHTIIIILMILTSVLSINNYITERKTFVHSWNINNFKEFTHKKYSNINNIIKLNILQNNNNSQINFDTLMMKIIQNFANNNTFFIDMNNEEFIDNINIVLFNNNFNMLSNSQSDNILKSFNEFKIQKFKTIPFIY